MTEHIRTALAEDPRTNELEIRVSIVAKDVFLSGVVATEERRRAVEAVVAELLPDHRVSNQTTVGDLAPAPGAEDVR